MAPLPASVICVSHSDGAQGEEIARIVAERTGFRYIDYGIILAAAQADKMFPEAVALAETRRPGRTIEVDFHRFEHAETLRELIRRAIRATADAGDVVIVAHAASFALTDRPEVLRVLVTASTTTRAGRVEAEGRDARSASKQIKESDGARAAYLKRFYGVGTEEPTHYDLVLNTDRLTPDAAAEAVLGAIAAS
jgi:cytidylate kinase